MDIHAVVRILRRQIVLIIAATLIGAAAGAVVAMTTPQQFEASTQAMVSVQVSETATSGERIQANSYALQVIESYRGIITSSLVLSPVVEDLGLHTTPMQLASRVRTSSSPGSTLLTITVSHTNPGQTARIANAVVESFATVVTEQLEKRDKETAYSIGVLTVKPAQVPLTPVAPNMRMSLILGTLLGFGIGVGIAVLRTALDNRIHNLADLENTIHAPVLGGIAMDPDAPKRPLIVAAAPRDPRAEAFRTLRTNVRFLFSRDKAGVFVVTSSGPGEGKSTTAANLAIAFAESGHKVALLDGDLRLPRVADYFGIEGGVGLSDVLVGRIDVNDAIQRWGRGTLFLLPSGTVPPNPAELLGSPAMETLVSTLTEAFDIVIIDAPPVLLVTDASVMSRLATGVIMVAAAGFTSKTRLNDAVKAIESGGSTVLGAVATMVPTTGADKTAYGTYSYAATS